MKDYWTKNENMWENLQNELAKYPGIQAGNVIYNDQDFYMPVPESEINKNVLLKQSLNY
jgi:starch-binding outer membrane protein, SusD/RagB family